VTNSGNDTRRLFKRRHGVCHRCGWSGLVGQVDRRDRGRVTSGGAYRRLCSECAADILHGPPSFSFWDVLETAGFQGDALGAPPETVLTNRGR
jgi:hypothetical protein